MFAKMPNFVGQARLYYPFKENKKHNNCSANSKQEGGPKTRLLQIISGYRRLAQIDTDYHRYQNITPGKMHLKHGHCNA